MHDGNGVAGVDGALEGVGGIHLGDVGDLPDIERGGHARGDVLAASGGREQDVAVGAGDADHLRGHVLGQAVGEVIAFDMDDLGDAGYSGGGLRGGSGIQAGDQHMHVTAALGGSGHGVQGGGPDARVVVFCNHKRGHWGLRHSREGGNLGVSGKTGSPPARG